MKGFNILRAYDYELKFGPNLGCTTENPFEILGKLLLQESKFIIFCPKLGCKELNHAATGFRLGTWGSKERRERREKGVLTAGHTRITFSSECPRDGDGEQLKCSEYIQSCEILQLITYASQLTLLMKWEIGHVFKLHVTYSWPGFLTLFSSSWPFWPFLPTFLKF